jgi:hypothetical protein
MGLAGSGRVPLAGAVITSCVGLGLLGACSALAETVTFKYTGNEQEFKVPAGVSSVHVVAIGSAGGTAEHAAEGGRGAVVYGNLTVKPDQMLYVEVGGVPFNGGGGSRKGGKGGGASDVRTVSIGAEASPGDEASLNSRLLVAAGGGGGGFKNLFEGPTCAGGAGGAAGENGKEGESCGVFRGGGGGGGGEASKGGAGGLGYVIGNPFSRFDGQPGELGVGGFGGGGPLGDAGGGGGGLYGGGGGGQQAVIESNTDSAGEGGGGGGSNLVPVGGEARLANSGEATSVAITYTVLPASQEQCEDGGWKHFGTTFKNQGQCVSFVEHEQHAAR